MNPVEEVRRIVNTIPPGQVITYGEIAALMGITPRRAGRLVGDLDESSPWWRVVCQDGSPATCHGGVAGSLLAAEGTPLRGDKVDIGRTRAT